MTGRRALSLALVVTSLACKGAGGGSSSTPPDDTPPPSGTVSTRLSSGTAALRKALGSQSTDDWLAAVNEFAAAEQLAATDTTATPADKDRARFFGGLSRVAVLLQPYSDGASDGLNDLGDLLDAFGVLNARSDRTVLDAKKLLVCTNQVQGGYVVGQTCKLVPFAATSPRSGELQAFLASKVSAGLKDAIAILDGVSSGFGATIQDGTRTIEFDATDALFVKAAAQAALALVELQRGYDLDVDVDALRAKLEGSTPYGFGDFLSEYPTFLRLIQASSVAQSRTDAAAAVHTLQAAVQSLKAETDAQGDDFIKFVDEVCSYDPTTHVYACTPAYNSGAQIAEFESNLATVEGLVTAAGQVTLDQGTASTADDVVVDPSKFFAGVDLRSLLPTSWTAGLNADRPGPFPDPTFAGVLVHSPTDPNADVDGDGSPDVFGYTWFGPWLAQTRFYSYGPLYGAYTFGAGGSTFVFSPSGGASYSGTAAWYRNTLTLTFGASLPALTYPVAGSVRSMTITSADLTNANARGFDATVTYRDAANALLTTAHQSFWRW